MNEAEPGIVPRFYSLEDEVSHLRLVRCPRRFADRTEVVTAMRSVGRLLDDAERYGRYLLVDSRDAPPVTDFEHGDEFRQLRKEIERGFARIAVLVRTKVGVLQANRIRTQDRSAVQVFDDESEALSFLLEDDATQRPSRVVEAGSKTEGVERLSLAAWRAT